MMRMIKKWMTGSFFLLLSLQGVWAELNERNQQGELSQPKPSAYISFVALGPRPARRFKMPRASKAKAQSKSKVKSKSKAKAKINVPPNMPHVENVANVGIPIPLDPREGTVPPSSLYLKDGQSWKRCSVGFNRSAQVLKVPSDQVLSFFRKSKSSHKKKKARGDSLNEVAYVKLPKLHPASQWIIFLEPKGGRDMAKRIWSKEPAVRVLRLNSKPMKDKNVLFRNGSSEPIVFYLADGAPHVLPAGRRVSFKLPPKKGVYRVRAEIGESKKKQLFDGVIKVSRESLTVIAFYDESLKNHSGKSVGVTRMRVHRLSAEALQTVRKSPKAK